MSNAQIAQVFYRIAELLQIKGENPYRIRAYEKAALVIESLTEPIEKIYREGRLTEIPGIGQSIAEKISELIETGKLSYLEELEASIPAGVVELLKVPEVGPKTAWLVYKELGIKSIEELEEAARAGKLRNLPGMGPKSEENILKGIERLKRFSERVPLGIALPFARQVVEWLKERAPIDKIEPAGSLRRWKETIGDIDILVTSTEPMQVMDAFVSLPIVREVLAKGETKTSVVTEMGIQMDVRVVEPDCFGAALQYFTGSKDHNIHLRRIAQDMGLKISEYGVFRGDEKIAGVTEEEVYNSLGLPFIPPELREDRGEIEAAAEGKLPHLIELKDLKGDLHVHTKHSDGNFTIEEMALAAKQLGYEYIGIADHTKGLGVAAGQDEQEILQQKEEIERLNEKMEGITILAGVEVNIRMDGTLDIDEEVLDQLDFVIASVHSAFKQPKEVMTERICQAMEREVVDIIGHPTGRLIGKRDAYEVDTEILLDTAVRTKTILEINAFPDRLDLPDTLCRAGKGKGLKFAINTDAHSIDQLNLIEYGVATARRGWLEKEDVVNCLPLEELLKVFRRK
ncbi:DNA polymerase/3'-5' exonuclease PolX [bacterium]|nr:DNA polymerase/3'-5' exonuclease PolX [bacterium]